MSYWGLGFLVVMFAAATVLFVAVLHAPRYRAAGNVAAAVGGLAWLAFLFLTIKEGW